MKVGLLTFHSAHNYGAILQAYATQEVVKKLGHKIEVIDYRPPYLIQQYVLPRIEKRAFKIKIKLLIEGLICLPWRMIRRRGFLRFMQTRLHLTRETYEKNEINIDETFDTYIIGSDQVWNIKLTRGFDPVYWGQFRANRESRKITYAASMSNYSLSNKELTIMGKFLHDFHSISVREEALSKFLNDSFGISAETVLDPVFLLEANDWKKISKNPRIHQKYILVYTISLREEVLRIARAAAKEFNARIIELGMGVDKFVFSNNYQTTSPEEYLGLFEHAEYIITSSFHGTAFSILFNRPFYSIAHNNDKDSRQKTILGKLGLLERFIPKDANPIFDSFDYSPINEKLIHIRDKSITFLANNLSK